MIFAWLKRFIPHVYVGDKTDTVAVTLEEGGAWQEFPLGPSPSPEGWRVHSILFNDGSVWDAVNGWRGDKWRVNETWIKRHGGKFAWWYANDGWKQ